MASPFVNRYPLKIETASPADIIRPSSFTAFGINSYTAAAGKVIDLRGRRGFNHDTSQGANIATFRVNGATGSCFTGGTTTCVNQSYLDMPWAEAHGHSQWDNPPGLRVDDATGELFVEGFHIHGAMDGLIPDSSIADGIRINFNAIFAEAIKDDGLQNDNCKTVSLKNCYIQGHAAISERPSGTPAFTGEITKVDHCLFWQKRQRWCGDEKFHSNTSGGDSGHAQSRKIGTWNSPTDQNNTNVNHQWDLHLGWGHKWWLKPDEAPGIPAGFFRTRFEMRNTLIRMDTIPVEGTDVVFPPVGDGIGAGSVNGSFYENVTILWMQGGSWPFPAVPAGVTIKTDTDECWSIWNLAELEWFEVNGYVQSSNSFDWTRFPSASVPTSDSFIYTVADDWGQRTATVGVTIEDGGVLFVTASDDGATTSPGTAITIPVLANDTATASLLPLVVQPGSVTNPSPSGIADITAAGDQIRYTPASGASGLQATFSYTAKPSAAATPTSTATVRVQILSVPPPPGSAYPLTSTNIFHEGGDLGQYLNGAYASIEPDTTIWLPRGGYRKPGGGSWLFDKTAGLNTANPIVIRPVGDDWLGPLFSEAVHVSGNDHIFAGVGFPVSLRNALKVSGDRSRISRCKTNYTGTLQSIGLEITIGDDIRVDRNDISNKFGTGGANSKDMCIRCSSNPTLPLRPILEYNWVHDCDGRASSSASINGAEGIAVGEGGVDGFLTVNGIIRFNLIEKHLNESESISIKSSGNTLTGNTLRNCNSATSRHGGNNTWIGNSLESSRQFVVWQDKHYYNGNVGSILLDKGNSTVASYYANGHTQATNRPAPTSCKVYNHTGTIRLGGGSVGSFLPLNNTIHLASHSGTFDNQAGSGTVTTGVAPARPAIISLSGTGASPNVGPFAP